MQTSAISPTLAAAGTPTLIELHTIQGLKDVHKSLLRGQVIMLRGGLQQAALLKALVETSLEGIRNAAGPAIAERVERLGFDRIHDIVDSADIPPITEAVYQVMKRDAPGFLRRFVPVVFGVERPFYFEREPNVRFHIPYDRSVSRRQEYEQFARQRGQGKVTAHGPHRDSWLNCPDNAVNAWIAVGPVQLGNGLTFFPDTYGKRLAHTSRGEITREVNPGSPLNVEMRPGDILLFHGDQLHASELNRTDATRYVISFRLTFDKPHFPHGHFHHYMHSSLSEGPYRWLAELPANLQWSYVSFRARWASKKVFSLMKGSPAEETAQIVSDDGNERLVSTLSDLPRGTIRPATHGVCVARLQDDRVVAFSRRCPHQGADLALGTLQANMIVCPWHNLAFDPATGASSCTSLHALKLVPAEVVGDRIVLAGRQTAD
jgi:nitrite reductase/ring-hydroxylating ferredoxin subunit